LLDKNIIHNLAATVTLIAPRAQHQEVLTMKLNTRLFHRIRYATWVRIIPLKGRGMMGNIEDISATGLGLLQDKPVETGGECHVYFMLPFDDAEHIIQARCRIASCRPLPEGGFLLGLAFLDFVSDNPGEALRIVERFVHFVQTHADGEAAASL